LGLKFETTGCVIVDLGGTIHSIHEWRTLPSPTYSDGL